MAKKETKSSSSIKSRKREITGIFLIAVSLFVLVALVTHYPGDWPNSSRQFGEPYKNLGGWLGAFVSNWILALLGYTGYALLALVIITGVVVFMHKSLSILVKPAIFLVVLGVFLPLLAGLIADIGSGNTLAVPSFTFGGIAGGLFAGFLTTYMGKVGAFILSITAVLVTIVLTTSIKLSTCTEWVIDRLKPLVASIRGSLTGSEKDKKKPEKKPPAIDEESPEETGEEHESPFLTPVDEPSEETGLPEREPTIVDYNSKITAAEEEPADDDEEEDAEANADDDEEEEYGEGYEFDRDSVTYADYELPGPELLDEPVNNALAETREEMLEKARGIIDSLRHFNIEAEVRQITPGPIVTRYELTLAPGIKVNKVVGLSDDLAMTLKAKDGIRILAPIPGKAAIGIEVPNTSRSIVYIREIAESEAFARAKGQLVCAIGKSTSGDPVVADLEKMPHLLIAGSTGAGKSVCINTLIASILMKAAPDMVRMIMIDPKVVELSIYNSIPHLLTPVITDPKRAADSLRWAVREMENRYRRLASMGVRDISQYNAKVEALAGKSPENGDEEIPEPLPLIVILIDEYADLMVVASNEIEESIARIAQMARAVGMHLVIATQRPSADVITGLIKANFPSRIAFKVMQASNSRIILDQSGADKLLGLGDMLFLQAGRPEPIRIHGAYISNEESERLVDFVASQSKEGPVEVNEDMFRGDEEESENALGLRDPNERDDLFYEAARLVVRHQQGSVSLLQRRLKVGYARAARLIDQLELAGIVSPYDGSKAREVLVDTDYIDQLEAGNL
ncbi:DNA translocase FtsK [bacterium]|nr:DNA translocase FtsK [bacterium]